jgi:hypothetical protein
VLPGVEYRAYRLALRFVAGRERNDAIALSHQLADDGLACSVDHGNSRLMSSRVEMRRCSWLGRRREGHIIQVAGSLAAARFPRLAGSWCPTREMLVALGEGGAGVAAGWPWLLAGIRA